MIGLTQVVFALGFDVVLWQRSLTADDPRGIRPRAGTHGHALRPGRPEAAGRREGEAGRSSDVSADATTPEPKVAAPAPAK